MYLLEQCSSYTFQRYSVVSTNQVINKRVNKAVEPSLLILVVMHKFKIIDAVSVGQVCNVYSTALLQFPVKWCKRTNSYEPSI